MDKKEQTAAKGIVIAVAIGIGLAFAGSSGSVDAGPIPAFALCGLLSLVINMVGFGYALATRTERYYDITGSFTYISVTLVALLTAGELGVRRVVAGAMVLVWAGRLGTFLFRRISRDGKDQRFDEILTSPIRLALAWTLQALWVFLTASAAFVVITDVDTEPFGVFALVGLVVWIVGLGIEIVADTQKSAFRADPANKGRFISTGIWAWSRHPNYFGEIMLWTGVAIFAIPNLNGWRLVALISPVFVFVLLNFVSGVPMLEKRAEKTWGNDPDYRAYADNTPSLLLRPPR